MSLKSKTLKVVWLAPYQLSLLKPHISFTKKSFPERAAPWIEHLSNELGKLENIELTIITKSAHIIKDLTINKNGIKFIILKYNFPFTNKGFPKKLPIDKIFSYYPLPGKIRKLIKKINPDIVHAHGTESVFSLAAQKSNFPYIISIQGLIHIINKTAKRKDIHQEKIEISTIKNGHFFGCRTIWDKAEVLKFNSKANIKYLPEAIDPLFFNVKWNPQKEKHIAFVGNITENKGIHILIDTFIKLKKRGIKLNLDIIGGGNTPLKNTLISKLENEGFDQSVFWHGYIPHSQMQHILSKSYLFVLPTFIDNSPNSLCEAMVMGMPCIASNVGGVPSLINNGVNGLLVEKNNIDELAEKIQLLLENNNLSMQLGSQASIDAFNRHHPKMVANQTIKVYKEIIESYDK